VNDHPRIEQRFETVVREILGEQLVQAVRIAGAAGGAESELPTDAVFPFPGLVSNNTIVAGIVELDPTGRIAVDAELRSTARGICAAGNVRQASSHRAAGAMGDGAAAAVALDRYLDTGEWRRATEDGG
jgi:thioredoxin reductase (NADPH)